MPPGVAGGTPRAVVADGAALIALRPGGKTVDCGPGSLVVQGGVVAMAMDTATRFVAGRTGLSVPGGRDAVGAHAPQASVAPWPLGLVAGLASIGSVTQRTVLSVPFEDSPRPLAAVTFEPAVGVIRRRRLARIGAVARDAAGLGDFHAAVPMAGRALLLVHQRFASGPGIAGGIGVALLTSD